ncbi:hypothetical protein HDE_04813 [Halotydeus destructor]|nr:hypothetical protein HDE_04813 [Halotydeus destructor]
MATIYVPDLTLDQDQLMVGVDRRPSLEQDRMMLEKRGQVTSRDRFTRRGLHSSLRLKKSATSANMAAADGSLGAAGQRVKYVQAAVAAMNNNNNLSAKVSRNRSFNSGKLRLIDGQAPAGAHWTGTPMRGVVKGEPPNPMVRLSSVLIEDTSPPRRPRALGIFSPFSNSSPKSKSKNHGHHFEKKTKNMVSSLSSLSGYGSSVSGSSSDCPSPVTPKAGQRPRSRTTPENVSSPLFTSPNAPGYPRAGLASPHRVVSLPRDMKLGLGLSLVSSSSSSSSSSLSPLSATAARYAAIIGSLDKESPADRCGQLYAGDAILMVNGTPVPPSASLGDVRKLIKEAGPRVTLCVRHCRSPGGPEVTGAAEGTRGWSSLPASCLQSRLVQPDDPLAEGSFLTNSASPASSMVSLAKSSSAGGRSFIAEIKKILTR